MSLKTCTTVGVALKAVKKAAALTDDARALELLNEIRQWVHSQQRQLGLDLSKTLCMEVQDFCGTCPTDPAIRGFRLPGDTLSVDMVAINSGHVDVHSHWRLPYDGLSGTPCDGKWRLMDRGFRPTERDIVCGCSSTLRAFSCGATVESQEMVVTGRTIEGREETVRMDVSAEPMEYPSIRFTDVTRVSFPAGASGVVVLRDDKGRELARYMPGDTVPIFRDYRLIGNDCTCIRNVVVVANHAYRDVFDACDIVEFGNVLVWKWLAKYIVAMGKSDKNGNDRANIVLWLQTATDLMVQEAAVTDGENTIHLFQRHALGRGNQLSHNRHAAV
jgi:hypothetical protein